MSIKDTIAAQVIKAGLRVSFKLPSRLPLPVAVLRLAMEQGALLLKTRKDVMVEPITIGGVRAERITPKQKNDKIILHLHGGAFFTGSAKTHRALGAEFAVRAHAMVYMLDYRLAPEHTYPAALDDGLAAYRALLALGYDAHNIVLGGDSSGCAHILSLVIALREQGEALPAAMFMISPYVDITLGAESVSSLKYRDPMVTAHALQRGSDGYRGSISANDSRVSPLFANLHGLPPMLIQVGSQEILLDDALRLAEFARAAGVDVDCQIYEGMWHNFQMFNTFITVAGRAIDNIAYFAKESCATLNA